MHAWGLRLRRAAARSRFTRASVLPSGLPDTVGSLDWDFGAHNFGIPSLHMPLSNASSAASRLPSHGSGSGWFATPFLHDSFIHYSTPVYPDANQANCLPHLAATNPSLTSLQKLLRTLPRTGTCSCTFWLRLCIREPYASLTCRTPSTMALSLRRAAQRAVWPSPQSGAKDNRSGGAYRRHRRTRSATSSAVSM